MNPTQYSRDPVEMDKLREALGSSVTINSSPLSYVDRLFPELKGSRYIFLHKLQRHVKLEQEIRILDDGSEYQESKLDLTGSPLKYSFTDDNFEDTVIAVKKHWLNEEEEYLPFSRQEACNLLNVYLECIPNKLCPIFALCDGKDTSNSRLLGTIVSGEWFSTIEVRYLGIESLISLKKSPFIPLQEHMKLSPVEEHDVSVSVLNVFDLYGAREEMFNWKEIPRSSFEGCISIEVNNNSLALDASVRTSKNDIIVQIVGGSETSPLKDLWHQLQLINQYLTILETYKKNIQSQYNSLPLQFPKDFTTPYSDEYDKIMEDLSSLLNGDYRYRNPDKIDIDGQDLINEEAIQNEAKLEQYVSNIKFRHNQDFTDFFWEIVRMNKNYIHMAKCIHIVFEEVITHGSIAQVNYNNTTRLAKILLSVQSQNMISHLLSGSLPLEYVIDIGIEKLCRDYLYILLNARLGDVHIIRKKFGNLSSEEFQLDTYRKKLICMAQIHVCLEFMLLIQTNLECSTENLGTLFSCAFEKFVCEDSPLHDCNALLDNFIYSLTAPVPISIISDLSNEAPATRRVSLSSHSKLCRLTTTRYYSRLPIFPTSIFESDDSSTVDDAYHVISVTCTSNKMK